MPILKGEIELFKQMGIEKMVLLGRIALKAFQIIGFKTLKGRSMKTDYGRIVEEAGLAFFIGSLPFPRNKRYWDEETKNRLREFLGVSKGRKSEQIQASPVQIFLRCGRQNSETSAY